MPCVIKQAKFKTFIFQSEKVWNVMPINFNLVAKASTAGGLWLVALITFAAGICEAQLVGTHPDAINQPTTYGRSLHTLHVADDNVYVGYGDYTENTGPINIRYFDTATDTFSDSLVTGNTEAFHRFRTIGDDLFVTHADPLFNSLGGFARGPADASSAWTNQNVVEILHSYDIAQYDTTLFLAGSGGPTAIENSIIYQSTDDGANWTVSLDIESPLNGNDYSFSRIYGLGMIGENLYAQQSVFYFDDLNGDGNLQFNGEFQPELNVFDGNSWQTGPLMRTDSGDGSRMIDPEFFADHLVFRNQHSGALGTSPIQIFDGLNMEELFLPDDTENPASTWDLFVDDTGLYTLLENGSVWFTDDLEEWENIFSDSPANARSLAVNDGMLYIGGDNADLYRFTISSIPEPSAGTMLLALATIALVRRHRH